MSSYFVVTSFLIGLRIGLVLTLVHVGEKL